MKNVSIEEMVNNILTFMKASESNFNSNTIHEYELSYQSILGYLGARGITAYDQNLVSTACKDLCKQNTISSTKKLRPKRTGFLPLAPNLLIFSHIPNFPLRFLPRPFNFPKTFGSLLVRAGGG